MSKDNLLLARIDERVGAINKKLDSFSERIMKIDELVLKHDKMLTVRIAERKQNNKIIATLFTVFFGVASYIGSQILENYTVKQDRKIDIKIEKRLSEWNKKNQVISNNNNNEL